MRLSIEINKQICDISHSMHAKSQNSYENVYQDNKNGKGKQKQKNWKPVPTPSRFSIFPFFRSPFLEKCIRNIPVVYLCILSLFGINV